jgi:hypothetical protein
MIPVLGPFGIELRNFIKVLHFSIHSTLNSILSTTHPYLHRSLSITLHKSLVISGNSFNQKIQIIWQWNHFTLLSLISHCKKLHFYGRSIKYICLTSVDNISHFFKSEISELKLHNVNHHCLYTSRIFQGQS